MLANCLSLELDEADDTNTTYIGLKFILGTVGYIDHVLWYFDNWDWKNFYSQTSCVVSNEDINQRNWLYQWNSNGEITDATESQLYKTFTNIFIQRGLWKKVNTYTMARILWQDCVFFIVDLTSIFKVCLPIVKDGGNDNTFFVITSQMKLDIVYDLKWLRW